MAVSTPAEYARSAVWAPWDKYNAVWGTSGTPPAIGNGTVTAKYRREGITAWLRGAVRMGTTSTFGTGEFAISLPTGWTSSNDPATVGYAVGMGVCVPAAGAAYNIRCWLPPNATALRIVTNADVAVSVSSTSPAAWTANAANFFTWNIGPFELAS